MGRLAVRRLSSLSDDERARILERSTAAIFDDELRQSVATIVEDVRREGDVAVSRALARFDQVECPPDRLRVRPDEFERARRSLNPAVIDTTMAPAVLTIGFSLTDDVAGATSISVPSS